MRIQEIKSDSGMINDLRDYVLQHCKPWLDQTQNGKLFVYRGVASYSSLDHFVRVIKTNRRPKDSTDNAHQFMNWLIAQNGGRANRSNSAFVSWSRRVATHYGKPFVFLPIGNFNYTWHTHWADWYAEVNSSGSILDLIDLNEVRALLPNVHRTAHIALSGVSAEAADFGYWTQKKDGQPHTISHATIAWKDLPLTVSYLKNGLMIDQDLDNAIAWRNEIMIAAKSGLYINPILYQQLLKIM